MEYREFAPSDEISHWVRCYWTLESAAMPEPEVQTIVPDGSFEMIFNYGDVYQQFLPNDRVILQPACFVFGQITEPLKVQPTGTTGIFSIRFTPGGFSPFATIPLSEMENRATALHELYGETIRDLEYSIISAGSVQQRIETAESFLRHRIMRTPQIDSIIRETVGIILTANGQLSINEVARRSGISQRQLERKFAAQIGLSPKQLSRTIRLQSALKLLLRKNYSSLTEVAYEGNYHDQAHFIREFRELTGFTPKEIYGDSMEFSHLFYGPK